MAEKDNSGGKSALNKPLNNESNFTIGYGPNNNLHFLSLNRQAAESVNNDVIKRDKVDQSTMKELQKDLRMHHFNMGNTAISYVSHAGNTMVEHPITTDQIHKQGAQMVLQKENMRKANFKLPYTQDNKTEQSTYKQCISNNVVSNQLAPGKP